MSQRSPPNLALERESLSNVPAVATVAMEMIVPLSRENETKDPKQPLSNLPVTPTLASESMEVLVGLSLTGEVGAVLS